MFARILVAIDDFSQSQAVLDLAKGAATEGVSEVRALHLRVREVSGFRWYSRETKKEASFVADAATFELRMAGLAAGAGVRYVAVDRVAEAILAEAEDFGADLIVLGRPRRGEVLTRMFGSVTLRVIRRSRCPVLVAQRRSRGVENVISSGASAQES
jgi:nucleotide-binding universal stress UspA family protein